MLDDEPIKCRCTDEAAECKFCAGKKKAATEQTEPPSIPVADFFPNGVFPEGEWQSYNDK